VAELVLSNLGRYVFVQSGGGWELRERVDARRRARWAIGGLLIGAAAVVWDQARHPFALALALFGAGLVLSGLRTKGRRLVIRDAEIAWGYSGEEPVRSALWPRARIACVLVERGSRLADPKLRRRAPVWAVRIRARDGELHPASFVFATEPTARALAETLARHLGAALELGEAAGLAGSPLTSSRRRSDPRRPAGTAPRPGRLDPR